MDNKHFLSLLVAPFIGKNSKTIFLWRGINDPWQNHSCNLAVMRGRAVIRTRNAICSHWFIHHNIAVCPFSLLCSNAPQLLKIALPYWPILSKLNEHGNVSSRYCGFQRWKLEFRYGGERKGSGLGLPAIHQSLNAFSTLVNIHFPPVKDKMSIVAYMEICTQESNGNSWSKGSYPIVLDTLNRNESNDTIFRNMIEKRFKLDWGSKQMTQNMFTSKMVRYLVVDP